MKELVDFLMLSNTRSSNDICCLHTMCSDKIPGSHKNKGGGLQFFNRQQHSYNFISLSILKELLEVTNKNEPSSPHFLRDIQTHY